MLFVTPVLLTWTVLSKGGDKVSLRDALWYLRGGAFLALAVLYWMLWPSSLLLAAKDGHSCRSTTAQACLGAQKVCWAAALTFMSA